MDIREAKKSKIIITPAELHLLSTQQNNAKKKSISGVKYDEKEEDDDDLGFLMRLRSGYGVEIPKTTRISQIIESLNVLNDEEDEEEEEYDRYGSSSITISRPKTFNDNDLFRSLELMDLDSCCALIDYYGSEIVNDRDENYSTALAVAIRSGFFSGVKYLLHKSADVMDIDKNLYSALHYATKYFDEMPLLLPYLLQQRGMDPNHQAVFDGNSCLHLVNDDRSLRILLSMGGDPSLMNHEQKSIWDVIEESCQRNNMEMKKFKKKAKQFLMRRSPYQSYQLFKLRFLNKYDSINDKIWSTRLERDIKEVDSNIDVLYGTRISVEEDKANKIICREEIPGRVYSFVNSKGRLCFARVDGSQIPSHGGATSLSVLKKAKADIFDIGQASDLISLPSLILMSAQETATSCGRKDWTWLPALPNFKWTNCPPSGVVVGDVLQYVVQDMEESVFIILQQMLWTMPTKNKPSV